MNRIISEAFFEMTKKKNIDKITVKDLVDVCGISRQTFYYHFQDIIDVIEWTSKQAFDEALEKSLQAESPDVAIHHFVSMAIQHRDLTYQLLHSQKREYVEKMFQQGFQTYLRELISNRPANISLPKADIDMAICFYSYGITGILLQYCSQKNPDADKISQQMAELLHATLSEINI